MRYDRVLWDILANELMKLEVFSMQQSHCGECSSQRLELRSLPKDRLSKHSITRTFVTSIFLWLATLLCNFQALFVAWSLGSACTLEFQVGGENVWVV